METGANPKAWGILAILALLLSGMGQSDSSATSMMYWTDFGAKKIQRANLDGSGVTNLITTGLGKLAYIALDTAGGKMYWTDSGLDSIQRANLNGSHIEALVTTGLSSPGGIALDVDAGKMYWTDSLTHKIQRANLNGSGVENLVTTGLQWPQGIALDVTGGKMYWTDGGTDKIKRANLDGSGVEVLYTIPFGSGSLQGIALDVSAGKMYWADLIQIQRANLDGSYVEFLVTTGGRLRGIALDVAAGKMYWTDTLWYGKIQCANLDGSGVKDLVVGGMNFPIGLALDVPKPPKIIYVDGDAGGANNGSSWADAYNYLQNALTVASSGDEIRVAQGIYKPDRGVAIIAGDRTATFQLKNGVSVKGGYAGFGEPNPNAHDIDKYKTILSGDLLGNDGPDFANNSENSYHVVTGSGCDESAVLNGSTITGGNANDGSGGGMYNNNGSPTVINCTFNENSADWNGGGIFNERNSSPTLTNCNFTGNSASYGVGCGGGMANWDDSGPTLVNCTFSGNSALWGGGVDTGQGSVTLTNCTFNNNSAVLGWGGAMETWNGSATLTNCAFFDNSADYGGGIRNYNSSTTVVNCTFTANTARLNGGGMYNDESSRSTLANCILWGNEPNEIFNDALSSTTVTYSNVQGGFSGEGNIDTDPCFVDGGYWDANGVWIDGDYHLLQTSACINAADNNSLPADTQDLDSDWNTIEPIPFDIEGSPRIVYDVVDIGAFEFDNTPPIADAGPSQIVECACNTGESTKVMLDGTKSSDPDRGVLTYTWTGPFVESPAQGATPTITLEDGCPGDYVIMLVVNDGIENSEPNHVLITVVDTTPPQFQLSVAPTMLWPPTHKMVLITPYWTVSDDCVPTPLVSLISIVANEGDNTVGDGHTSNDIQINEDGSIYLRSERSGTGSDRVYTITYQAFDDSGNAAVGSATVSIPHDFKVLARIAARWLWTNRAGRISEDLNGDGVVNLKDIAIFANNWIQ